MACVPFAALPALASLNGLVHSVAREPTGGAYRVGYYIGVGLCLVCFGLLLFF